MQTACTITGYSNGGEYDTAVIVTAENAAGQGPASEILAGPQVDLQGLFRSPWISVPGAPAAPVVSTVYIDGIEISWGAPADDGGGPIVGYRVTARNGIDPDVTCEAWWDETSCVLLTTNGLVDGAAYDIDVVALQLEGAPAVEYQSAPATIPAVPVFLTGSPAPIETPDPFSGIRIPDAILDFTMTSTDGGTTDVSIAGYIAVPQGRVEISAAVPADVTVDLMGGIVAGDIWLDPAGVPANMVVEFDNPIAQKTVRIRSVSSGRYIAVSDAIVQINKSGSIAINSWLVQ